ncbi:MAG: hypothetical protein M3R30_03830 [Candidatus Eremiobacteraeota bacterium]|nr:hypothetical protein [Candidatus Eremiobacteraeota bacterium]
MTNANSTSGLSIWRDFSGLLDGCYEESWADGGLGLAQQASADLIKMANARYTDNDPSADKIVLVENQNATYAGQVFGLAMMMLTSSGHSRYGLYGTGSGNWWNTVSPPAGYTGQEFSTAAAAIPVAGATGAPQSGPHSSGADAGLWVRVFSNSTVRINLNTSGSINGVAAMSASIQ